MWPYPRPGLWINRVVAGVLCVGWSGPPGCLWARGSLRVPLVSSLSRRSAGISCGLGSVKPGREHSGLGTVTVTRQALAEICATASSQLWEG